MKKYIKSDINSYSYTGSGFADDTIILAEYEYDDGYIELSLDGSELLVSHCHYSDANEDTFTAFSLDELGFALTEYNRQILAYGEDSILTRAAVNKVLSKYGKSIDDDKSRKKVSSATSMSSGSYLVQGYADKEHNNLAASAEASSLPEADAIIDSYANSGYYIVFRNRNTGTVLEFSPDNWLSEIYPDGGFSEIGDF